MNGNSYKIITELRKLYITSEQSFILYKLQLYFKRQILNHKNTVEQIIILIFVYSI